MNLVAGGEGGAPSPASALDAFAPVALPPSPAALALAALALSNSSSPVAPGHAALRACSGTRGGRGTALVLSTPLARATVPSRGKLALSCP